MSISRKLLSVLGMRGTRGPQGPTPDRLTYAIGDVHGRLDLLDQLIARIEQDRAGQAADVVFLGDYIDRGPDSAAVLARLRHLSLDGADVICLLGNHERMFLDFVADPVGAGARWLQNGGRETVASFAGPDWTPPGGDTYETACRDIILETADTGVIDWLGSLPLQWRSGDLGCVHAMADPRLSWDEQPEAVLLWGRPKPNMPPRSDGIWIVYGHTVVETVEVHNQRIAIDTGAFLSGTLTALRCDKESIGILSAADPEADQL